MMKPVYDRCTLPVETRGLDRGSERGIVTGGSYIHWPCIGALAIGAAKNSVSFGVADHGLADWQREELCRVGVQWIEHEQPNLTPATSGRLPPSDVKAWWKPWVCLASPFERSIWVDADAVVVGDLSAAFEILETQPFVSSQSLWQANGVNLYSDVVNYLFGASAVHRELPKFANINTGVIGFRKDESLIDDWRTWCTRLLENPRAMRMCKVRDQTGYVVSLVDYRVHGKDQPLILAGAYNVPAGNLPAGASCNRPNVPLCPCSLWDNTAESHPGAVVVHWLGGYKPWGRCRNGQVMDEKPRAVLSWKQIDGKFRHEEGALLQEIARDKVVIEIGSLFGRSTVCLAEVASHVHAIDPHLPGNADFSPRWRGKDSLRVLRQNLRAAGVSAKVSVYVCGVSGLLPIQPGSVDLVFIDGAHDSPSVASDLRFAEQVVTRDGAVACHDYDVSHPGVVPVVDAFLADRGWAIDKQAGGLVVLRRIEWRC